MSQTFLFKKNLSTNEKEKVGGRFSYFSGNIHPSQMILGTFIKAFKYVIRHYKNSCYVFIYLGFTVYQSNCVNYSVIELRIKLVIFTIKIWYKCEKTEREF